MLHYTTTSQIKPTPRPTNEKNLTNRYTFLYLSPQFLKNNPNSLAKELSFPIPGNSPKGS